MEVQYADNPLVHTNEWPLCLYVQQGVGRGIQKRMQLAFLIVIARGVQDKQKGLRKIAKYIYKATKAVFVFTRK